MAGYVPKALVPSCKMNGCYRESCRSKTIDQRLESTFDCRLKKINTCVIPTFEISVLAEMTYHNQTGGES